MSSVAIEGKGRSAGSATSGRLKTLFLLPSIARYRMFEGLVAELLAAGHEVVVGLDERHAGVDHLTLRRRTGMWAILASAVGRTLDYLRYLEPEHASAEHLSERARARAPRAARALLFLPPFRWAFGRRALSWTLRMVEAGIPPPRHFRSLLAEHQPDLVLIASSPEHGPAQSGYIRAADAAGVPSLLVVAGEDDVACVRGLPRGRIIALGAHSTDIENAARTEVAAGWAGRIAGVLLWTLAPLLMLALVLLRPRASARAARRLVKRIRRRAKRLRRERGEAPKAMAASAKAEKRPRTEATRQRKEARARLKAERRARREKPRG